MRFPRFPVSFTLAGESLYAVFVLVFVVGVAESFLAQVLGLGYQTCSLSKYDRKRPNCNTYELHMAHKHPLRLHKVHF